MNPWRGLRGLPRGVWIISFASLINRAGTMVLPFLVLYLTQALHFSDGRAGVILALYGVASLVASPISGKLCDRYGAMIVMRVSLAASGAMLLAFPLVKSFPAVVATTLLLSLSGEMLRPANMTMLSELAPAEQRKPAFALSRLAVNLGMSIGPVVGGFLVAVSYPALFIVDGVTSLAAAAVLIVALRTPDRAGAHGAAGAGTHAAGTWTLGALADRRFLYFVVAMLPAGIVFFQIQGAMPLYVVRDVGLSERAFGMVLTVNTLLIVFLEVPLNTSTAHWPHRRALALGALLIAVGFGTTAFVTGAVSLAATVVVWTFAEMILFPGSGAYVADLAPPERRGEYMGMYSMTFGMCFSIGPWLGTVILERWGGKVLWGSMFLLGLVSAALMAQLPEPSSVSEK
jgi:MFS family permease